jgi:pyruvate dehydrogenase E2 component (dihydrolipoamide acetyltransferase)
MSDIVMPQLGESVTEGTITRWFKAVGEAVSEDEPLFEVSTDKVDTEVPAPASGVLSEIRVEEGDTVEVGTVLAVLGDSSGAAPPAAGAESAPTPAPEPAAEPAPAAGEPEPQPAATAPPASTPAPSQPAPEPVRAGEPAGVAPPEPVSVPDSAEAEGAGGGALLSPLVRRLVEEHGLDPSTIQGSGVGGRITREDVLAEIDRRAAGGQVSAPAPAAPAPAPAAPAPAPAAPAPAPAAPAPAPAAPAPAPAPSPVAAGGGDHAEPLNNIRRLTGQAMVESKAAAPHAITVMQVDYEGVERVRRARRDDFRQDEGFSLTYLPFVSRAVVDALAEFPHMNASMGDDSVVLHDEVHLSIAVDLDFNGLLAPVVRDAHDKRLRAIARDIRDLAERARSKRLSPDELSGGTFTLSNSGSYGTLIVAPIINQPQVGILSTDGVSRQAVVVTDEHGGESITIHSVGNLTLSWDHRAFDGAYAAAFLARVKEIIETRDWAAEL